MLSQQVKPFSQTKYLTVNTKEIVKSSRIHSQYQKSFLTLLSFGNRRNINQQSRTSKSLSLRAIESADIPIGTKASNFKLLEPLSGKHYQLSDFESDVGLIIMVICNHCPYVKHLKAGILQLAKEYQQKGFKVVAISSNDIEKFQDDSPDKMAAEASQLNEIKTTTLYKLELDEDYTFPYLFDETQEYAKALKVMATPEFYVFDKNLELYYHGRFDDARPTIDTPVTGKDLRKALEDLLSGKPANEDDQFPSIGCSLKWKPGNEPAYM